MHRITESAIEQLTIEKLEALGYRYVYGPSLVVDGDKPSMQFCSQVILRESLKEAIRHVSPLACQWQLIKYSIQFEKEYS